MADVMVRPMASLRAVVLTEPSVSISKEDHESAKRHIKKLHGRILPPFVRDELREIEQLLRLT